VFTEQLFRTITARKQHEAESLNDEKKLCNPRESSCRIDDRVLMPLPWFPSARGWAWTIGLCGNQQIHLDDRQNTQAFSW
jgi:hypothetical protein